MEADNHRVFPCRVHAHDCSPALPASHTLKPKMQGMVNLKLYTKCKSKFCITKGNRSSLILTKLLVKCMFTIWMQRPEVDGGKILTGNTYLVCPYRSDLQAHPLPSQWFPWNATLNAFAKHPSGVCSPFSVWLVWWRWFWESCLFGVCISAFFYGVWPTRPGVDTRKIEKWK